MIFFTADQHYGHKNITNNPAGGAYGRKAGMGIPNKDMPNHA